MIFCQLRQTSPKGDTARLPAYCFCGIRCYLQFLCISAAAVRKSFGSVTVSCAVLIRTRAVFEPEYTIAINFLFYEEMMVFKWQTRETNIFFKISKKILKKVLTFVLLYDRIIKPNETERCPSGLRSWS